jgi:hypothetical protein
MPTVTCVIKSATNLRDNSVVSSKSLHLVIK